MAHPGSMRPLRSRLASKPQPLRPGRLFLRLALLPWMTTGLLLVLLLAIETEAGRGLLARVLTAATGGQVLVQGIGGELPFRPRIQALALSDAEGTWLRAADLALVVRPSALLRGELGLDALTIDRLEVMRAPRGGAGDPGRGGMPLPVRLERLVIAQLVPTALGGSVPPLAVTGSAVAVDARIEADLLLTAPGPGHHYELRLATAPDDHRLGVGVSEQAGGPLAELARAAGVPMPPDLGHWTLTAEAQGPLAALAVDAEIAAGAHQGSLSGVVDLPGRWLETLDARLRIAAMQIPLADRSATLGWDHLAARAELTGPLRAPRGGFRLSAEGLLWQRASGRAPEADAPAGRWRQAPGGSGVPGGEGAVLFAGGLALDGRIDLASGPGLSARLRAEPTQMPQPWGRLLGPAPRLSLSAARDGATWTISDGRLETALLDIELDGHVGVGGAEPDWALDLRLAEGRLPGIAVDGRLRVASETPLPTGVVELRVPRLEDIEPLLAATLPRDTGLDWARGIGGGLEARLTLGGADGMRLAAKGVALELLSGDVRRGARLTRLDLDGELRDPLGSALGAAQLRLTGLTLAGVPADLDVRAEGSRGDWVLDADARVPTAEGGGARIAGAGRLDVGAGRLTLERLTLDGRNQRVQLLAPAAVDFAAGVSLEAVRLGVSARPDAGADAGADSGTSAADAGELRLDGRITPALGVDARVVDLAVAALKPWLPGLPADLDGEIDAQASLAGKLRAPTGSVRVDARGLTLPGAARRGLPPAAGRLTLTLEQAAAQIGLEAWVEERARLTLNGRVGGAPWSAAAPLDLRGEGDADLALLDAWLGAGGRRAEGRIGLDLGVTGTRGAPRLDGRLRIDGGAWRDARLGLWLDDIEGSVRLLGERLDIERLTATAGAGTLRLEGGIGWLASGQPVDLRLRARNAEPLQHDALWLRGDADLALRGALAADLTLGGDARFERVNIRIPARLPADIPTLAVVEVGERRQPRPAQRTGRDGAWRERLALDLRLDAPGAIAVTGRNIDAQLGGEVRLRGTAAAPRADGGFTLLRGEYALLGESLRFTRGRIGFDGGDLLDPRLELQARRQGPGGTAILAVEGRALAPQLVLRGEPPMTDDEVLSRLLFGVPPRRLSALQLTRLGLAAASVAGIGGDGRALLEQARAGLGLERLRIGSDRRGETVVEGGRKVTERVYLGARQGAEGGEPRAVLRLQLAPQIRLESDVGGGGSVGAGAAFELDF